MYISIKHSRTGEEQIVTELDDLSFINGWRYNGQVSVSKINLHKVDENRYNRHKRIEEGFLDLSNLTLQQHRTI